LITDIGCWHVGTAKDGLIPSSEIMTTIPTRMNASRDCLFGYYTSKETR
jgi:hypothetical protein